MSGRRVAHEAKGKHLCSCGANFRDLRDLRRHLRDATPVVPLPLDLIQVRRVKRRAR